MRKASGGVFGMAFIVVILVITNLKLSFAEYHKSHTKRRSALKILKLKLNQGYILIIGLVNKSLGADIKFS